jgi:hypothetical protein
MRSNRKGLHFASTWVDPRIFGGVLVVYIFSFLCCVFLLCFVFFVFVLCLVFPILSVLMDCPFLISSSVFCSDYLHVNDRDFEKLELDKIITKTYQTAIYSQRTQVFEWVSDCCLAPTRQFVSYIMMRTS